MFWQKRSHLTFLSAGIVKQFSFQAQVAAHGHDFCRWLFSVCNLALDAVIHNRRRDTGHPQGPLALGADVPRPGEQRQRRPEPKLLHSSCCSSLAKPLETCTVMDAGLSSRLTPSERKVTPPSSSTRTRRPSMTARAGGTAAELCSQSLTDWAQMRARSATSDWVSPSNWRAVRN